MELFFIIPRTFDCEISDSSRGMGYGTTLAPVPLVSGVGDKRTTDITSLSEGITCFVGITFYLFCNLKIERTFTFGPMSGFILSIVVAARIAEKTLKKKIKFAASTVVLFLGLAILGKAVYHG